MTLSIRGLTKSFDSLKALNNVTFVAEEKLVTSVIGPNGAGKTTLFNVITGYLPADAGQILYRGKDITNLPPHKIVRKGIARSFQIVNIFPQLTVFENVQVALISHFGKSANFFTRAKNLGRGEAAEILGTVGLTDKAESLASTLAYGDQRIMEIAIALANRPDLLLLDEPTAGMGPEETQATVELIRNLANKQGLSIIIVEHDMDVVFAISDAIVVMHQGDVIAIGKPEEVRRNERVISVYLGEAE
jgi:branched-chain amino acid transport system ATP-binding protein